MHALLSVLATALSIYVDIIIVVAIMSWLIAFNVINLYNKFVRAVWEGLNALVEPALRPLRRILPSAGGLDLSPLVLILIIYFLQQLIADYSTRVTF